MNQCVLMSCAHADLWLTIPGSSVKTAGRCGEGEEKERSVPKNSLKTKCQCTEWRQAASVSGTRASWRPPHVIGNKQTLHKSRKYSVSINVRLVSRHRSAKHSLLITPPVISLTPCQPLPNPWYRLYSWHYGRHHLSTQRTHAVQPVQTAWLVGHPWLAVWSVSVEW